MNKAELLKKIQEKLEVQLEAALAEALSAKEAANHPEAKAENKYDTRGLEASYIAQAQAARVEKIKEDLYNLSKISPPQDTEKVQMGSLIKAFYHQQQRESFLILLPVGGIEVNHQGKTVKSISLQSPLGQKLIGLYDGDEIQLKSELIEVEIL